MPAPRAQHSWLREQGVAFSATQNAFRPDDVSYMMMSTPPDIEWLSTVFIMVDPAAGGECPAPNGEQAGGQAHAETIVRWWQAHRATLQC